MIKQIRIGSMVAVMIGIGVIVPTPKVEAACTWGPLTTIGSDWSSSCGKSATCSVYNGSKTYKATVTWSRCFDEKTAGFDLWTKRINSPNCTDRGIGIRSVGYSYNIYTGAYGGPVRYDLPNVQDCTRAAGYRYSLPMVWAVSVGCQIGYGCY
jgi:hypothetical protein